MATCSIYIESRHNNTRKFSFMFLSSPSFPGNEYIEERTLSNMQLELTKVLSKVCKLGLFL